MSLNKKVPNHFVFVGLEDYRFGKIAKLNVFRIKDGKKSKLVFASFRSEQDWRAGIGAVFSSKGKAQAHIRLRSDKFLYRFEKLAYNQWIYLFAGERAAAIEGHIWNPILAKKFDYATCKALLVEESVKIKI